MKHIAKSILSIGIASALFASGPVQAFSVTFGGVQAYQIDVDTNLSVKAGLTSNVGGYINAATNTVSAPGVLLETFDALASSLTRPVSGDANASEIQFPGTNGGFTTLNPNASAGILSIDNASGFGMGVRKGTTGYAAAPGGDCVQSPGDSAGCNKTYFAYGPGEGGSVPSEVKINYSALLLGGSRMIDYLGVYYGSIDTYNEMRFYDDKGELIHGGGLLGDGILSGAEILNAMSCSTCNGNQTNPNSNVYVNLNFSLGDKFTSFSFYTTGTAVEIDNIVSHIQEVPEPASLVLVGLGLLGLAQIGRRKVVVKVH
jgi:hypothetical protein